MKVLIFALFLFFKFKLILSDTNVDKTLFERDLVKKNPTSKEILDNYEKYVLSANRTVNGVLGFIEDTNEESYTNALVYAKKFTFLIPLWFNLEKSGVDQFKITGQENINKKWIGELIEKNPKLRVAPRITFNGWTSKDFLLLASSELEWINLSNELLNFCNTFPIHGLSFDLFDNWYGKLPDTLLISILQELSVRLRMDFHVALLIVPTKYANKIYFNQEIYVNLADYFSRIVLMTPIGSSMEYIEKQIEEISPEIYRKHISFNIGLDGYADNNKKITSKEYIEYLVKYDDVLEYDENFGNYLDVLNSSGEKERIFYPTLYFINQWVKLANNLGSGISVWCVGDGLNYFYELL